MFQLFLKNTVKRSGARQQNLKTDEHLNTSTMQIAEVQVASNNINHSSCRNFRPYFQIASEACQKD